MKKSTIETLALIIAAILVISIGFIYNEYKNYKPDIELVNTIQNHKDNMNELENVKKQLDLNQSK